MNDTCATHRSRVPRRSSGRNKRRSDNSGRRERTRPGFYFMFCVRQSSARGCRFSVMFVYLVIKMFKCSPVPASFFPYISTALHYHSLHRPRSVPTALGPAPLVTYPHRPSQAGGYSRDCALLPPSPLSRGEPVRAAAAYLGVRTDEARERRRKDEE